MKREHCWFVLLFLALLGFPQVATADGGYPSLRNAASAERTGTNDVAIIVGVERYPWLPDIAGVLDTVRDWEVFFERSLGVPTVYRLVENQATKETVTRFIAQAQEGVGEEGTLWFVFVGHGAPDPEQGDGLLVGVDAQPRLDSLVARSMRRSELIAHLEEGPQKRTVLVLDACFTGEAPSGEALIPGAQPVLPTRMSPSVRQDTVVLSAAGAGEIAGPLPELERPAFSYFLLGALRGWAADDSGAVTVNQAVHYARTKLRMLPDRQQTPEAVGDDSVILVRGVSEADPFPNWRGISPRQLEELERQIQQDEGRQSALQQRAREEAITQDIIDRYHTQRLFESETRFFQGSWSNRLDWKQFYTLIGDEELAEQYRPARIWAHVGTIAGTGLVLAGVTHIAFNSAHDPESGTSAFTWSWQTSVPVFLLGAYLGYSLGAIFFSERHPLEASERSRAAQEFNQRIANELGVPANLTLTPLLGESRGLQLALRF